MPESLFNKVVSLSPANLVKKRLWHRCFPVNFPVTTAPAYSRKFKKEYFHKSMCFWFIEISWDCPRVNLAIFLPEYVLANKSSVTQSMAEFC